MEKKIFSLEEANSLIPVVRSKLSNVVDLSTIIKLITEALRYSQSNPDKTSENENLEEKLDELSLEIKEAIMDIQKSGCVVKDVEKGIVDFYSEKDGEMVFLCWKLGENDIKYWHSIHSGFMGRVPISLEKTEE